MAIEVIRQHWCDQCIAEGNRVPATHIAIRANDPNTGRPLLFDGCDNHSDPRVSEIVKYGYPEPRVATKPPIRQSPNPARTAVTASTGRTHQPSGEYKVRRGERLKCNSCGTEVKSSSGKVLHENAHVRKGEETPNWSKLD